MSLHKIVSSGERGRIDPAGGPALLANGDRPEIVLRRSGRRSTLSFTRRNERPAPTWGDDPRSLVQRIDWGYVRLCLGVAVASAVLTHIALVRGG